MSNETSHSDVQMNVTENAVNEELVHKAEETQLYDRREPNPRSSLRLLPLLGWEIIWILIGMFFAAGMGVIPLVFFWVLVSVRTQQD
jgi:hypothetical protein